MNDVSIDLGCGMRKRDGYIGIDHKAYEGVDIVLDLRNAKLPYEDNSVDNVFASHFLEHLDFEQVIHLMNEIYRVLKVGQVFEIVVPHAMSYSNWSDLSHKTAWTEDTFGHFTPDNAFFYEWDVMNRWKVLKNDQTPPYEYHPKGWIELKHREIHAWLQKLPKNIEGLDWHNDWLKDYNLDSKPY